MNAFTTTTTFDVDDLQNTLDEIFHLINAVYDNIYESDALNIPAAGGPMALLRVAREKVSFVQEAVDQNFTPMARQEENVAKELRQ